MISIASLSGMSIGEHTIDTASGRILCIADIRGGVSDAAQNMSRENPY
jgi:hypothetical protein